ncbi:MAG: hypothetical protein HKN80_08460 [Acidimicrobiia bacterium]|nr:hypothetical protein [Acidimicrobiia bacterium]
MEHTEPDPTESRIGPTERPDDPLAAAQEKATRRLPGTVATAVDTAPKPAPPTPDLEGCYYFG